MKPAKWESESAMLAAFTARARGQGFRVVPEACGHDLILVAGEHPHLPPWAEPGDVVAVEGKLRASLTLLRQAIPPVRNARYTSDVVSADFYAVVVPGADPDFREVAEAIGIAVVPEPVPHAALTTGYGRRFKAERLAETGGVERIHIPGGFRQIGGRRPSVPAIDVEMPAGCPSPRSLSPWKIEAVRICLAGLQRELTIDDFRAEVKNRTFLDRGWMVVSRREGRKAHYTLTTSPTRPDLAYPEIADALLRQPPTPESAVADLFGRSAS